MESKSTKLQTIRKKKSPSEFNMKVAEVKKRGRKRDVGTHKSIKRSKSCPIVRPWVIIPKISVRNWKYYNEDVERKRRVFDECLSTVTEIDVHDNSSGIYNEVLRVGGIVHGK
jgi:hypothetical protein